MYMYMYKSNDVLTAPLLNTQEWLLKEGNEDYPNIHTYIHVFLFTYIHLYIFVCIHGCIPLLNIPMWFPKGVDVDYMTFPLICVYKYVNIYKYMYIHIRTSLR
jgi:hypothetical protein